MNGFNFTERVRKVLQQAREEAFSLHHQYVGTEHILLGLCEGGGVAEHALATLGATPGAVRAAVLQAVKPGTADHDESESLGGLIGAIVDSIGLKKPTVDLPYTSRAKKVLELAMTEARELNHTYVGTEHLLMGLLREERGIAAQVLRSLGITVHTTRQEIIRLLGTEMPGEHTVPAEAPRLTRTDVAAAITLVVEHPDGRIEAAKFGRTDDAVRFLNGLEY